MLANKQYCLLCLQNLSKQATRLNNYVDINTCQVLVRNWRTYSDLRRLCNVKRVNARK